MLDVAALLTPRAIHRPVRAAGTAQRIVELRPRNTAVTLGELVIPNLGTPDLVYECTTAGTTEDAADAGANPPWPTTVGAPVTDGTVVWTAKPKSRRYAYGGFIMGLKVGGVNAGAIYLGLTTGASMLRRAVLGAGAYVDLPVPWGSCLDLYDICIDAATNADEANGIYLSPPE